MYDSILIPTDGSDPSIRAADHGFELAAHHDATVHLLYVVEVTEGVGGAYGEIDGGIAGFDHDVLEGLEKQGTTITDDLADRAAGRALEVTTAVRQGTAPKEIREYAADHGIDLIVMGTHGRSGVERVLLGSVTERVLRTADVPVLIVRTRE